MYVCVYVCMCVCVDVYIYVYIHTFGVPWWFQHCFTTPAITSVSVNMLNHTWIPSTFLLKVKWGAIIWVTSCPKIRDSPKRRSPTNKHVFFHTIPMANMANIWHIYSMSEMFVSQTIMASWDLIQLGPEESQISPWCPRHLTILCYEKTF